MDFRRIEQIFLIVFLCLDAFLFNIFRVGRSEFKMNDDHAQEAIETRLKKDGITYSNLSTKIESGYYLSGEVTNFSAVIDNLHKTDSDNPYLKNTISATDTTLTCTPTSQYYVNETNPEKGLKPMIDSPAGMYAGNDYVYLKNFSNFKEQYPEIRLAQSFEGIPFIDDTSEVNILLETNADKLLDVTRYSQTHLQDIEPLREKQELCTEKDAVQTLYNNSKIPTKAKILWSQIGYSRILKVREKNVYVPVWFICIQDGVNKNVEHVNAINNTVITNTTINKVG
jgi:regulatory protein YycI of two-component signal transduction system YycFG